MRISRAVFLAAAGLAVRASVLSAADISVRIEPDKLTVGDELRLTCLIRKDEGESVRPILTPQTLYPFELKGVRTGQGPAAGTDGRLTEQLEIVLTAFETGDLELPAIPLSIRSAAGRSSTSFTPARKIKVVSVLTAADKSLRPIKGPVSADLMTPLVWMAALGVAVLIAGLIAAAVLRPRKAKPDPEARLAPEERARRELGRLRACSHPEQGRLRVHYAELADILRRFLERRYSVDARERTSAEILRCEPVASLETGTRSALRELLDAADLVKFAKATPDPQQTARLEESLLGLVERLAAPKERR